MPIFIRIEKLSRTQQAFSRCDAVSAADWADRAAGRHLLWSAASSRRSLIQVELSYFG